MPLGGACRDCPGAPETSRPAAPRTCRGPCTGLSGGRADRAHRWRRLGRRGPEGDVTGSGPGGRNRAAAASVAQQRAEAAQRAGAPTTSRAPGTRRQPERPTEGRRARSRRRCRHGALPPAQVRPPGLLLGPGRRRYAGAGRVPSRRHQLVRLRPAGVPAPAAARLPQGPAAGACLFSQPARRESSLPACGHRTTGYPGRGQDSG